MKIKSKAYLEAEAYRDQFNQGRTKIVAKDLSCVVYVYESSLGRPCAVGYRGRAKKPAFNSYYAHDARRVEAVSSFIDGCMERNTSYKADARNLEVGDVLNSTWGYGQTNQDYYLVTKLVGKSMVEICEIGKIKTHDDIDTGDCWPNPSDIVGEPMRKVANGDSVRVYSFSSAYKLEPIDEVGGIKSYPKRSWTSYH